MGIRSEIHRAGSDLFSTAKQAGKEVIHSKDAPEMAAEILIAQPAKIALNVFGISMRTALKISGILALRTAKLGLKGLAALPIFPFSKGGKETFDSRNFDRMARIAPITVPKAPQPLQS